MTCKLLQWNLYWRKFQEIEENISTTLTAKHTNKPYTFYLPSFCAHWVSLPSNDHEAFAGEGVPAPEHTRRVCTCGCSCGAWPCRGSCHLGWAHWWIPGGGWSSRQWPDQSERSWPSAACASLGLRLLKQSRGVVSHCSVNGTRE